MSFIELNNVSFTYSPGTPNEIKAVKNLSLSIEEGDFVALVGHNGSGKSTVAKLINGLLIPQKGKITVDGMDTTDKDSLFDIRKNVGVVFQNPDNQMVATIIEDDVAFGPENLGLEPSEIRSRVDWALKSVDMYEYREGAPFRLSGGQKQRIAIAGVLAIKPRAMILDESTSMLDPIGKKEIMDIVLKLNREEKMTVIMITHFMDEAALADKIFVMDDGELIRSGGKEVLNDPLLESRGLAAPPACSIAKKLRSSGMPIGEVYTPDELVEEICRLL
ncbi:MAG: energy-coupling factor transporter ATPase [Clostridiales bacterium]|nr:energy-coupling factor transporter ATPase [Clostridiales bacterium]